MGYYKVKSKRIRVRRFAAGLVLLFAVAAWPFVALHIFGAAFESEAVPANKPRAIAKFCGQMVTRTENVTKSVLYLHGLGCPNVQVIDIGNGDSMVYAVTVIVGEGE